MKKQVLFLNLLLFLLLIITGCSDDKPEIVQTLTVTKPELTFEAKGGKQGFSIKSNTKWEILTENKSWCKISPLKGEGDADIEVEVDESSIESILSTQLTVKISSKSAIVRIKQDAAVLPPPEGLHYPLLTINTEGGKNIESKDVYLNAAIKIEARDDKGEVTETLLEAETEIKGEPNDLIPLCYIHSDVFTIFLSLC